MVNFTVFPNSYRYMQQGNTPRPLALLEESIGYCLKEHIQRRMITDRAPGSAVAEYSVRICDDTVKIYSENSPDTVNAAIQECYILKNLAFLRSLNNSPIVLPIPDYSEKSYREQRKEAAAQNKVVSIPFQGLSRPIKNASTDSAIEAYTTV